MSWLVDNAISLSILLGVLAAALVLIWRSNGQNKYLGYAAGAVALLGAIWLLAFFVPTDRKQLESKVNAMADAVVAGKVDDLFKHISKDFRYEFRGQSLTRDQLYEAAQLAIRRGQVASIRISKFEFDEVSRAKKTAKVKFRVTAFDAGEKPYPFVTRAEFVLEGDEWRLKTMRFFKTFVDTDQEIGLPGM